MTESSSRVLREYLQNAIATENKFEDRFREFANEGDDSDVQFEFSSQARRCETQSEQLTVRLNSLGGSSASSSTPLIEALDSVAHPALSGGLVEEQLLEHLLLGFTMATGKHAMYGALAMTALAAGDQTTAEMAREIGLTERQGADVIFKFIPSRSKIAFNMLTLAEVDPSVETKTADDRIVEL